MPIAAIFLLLYVVSMVVIGILGLIATIVTCRNDWQKYHCPFHAWRRHKIFGSGAYWYYECSACQHRDALKVHKGYSPIDQNWLNGGRRTDIAVYAPDGAEPPKWLTEGPAKK
ncbi:MAG: hypothetical protein Q8P76_02935 [bacterium]|nr:hypothetical protein [bacterium]